MASERPVYTIGYAGRSIDQFLSLLQENSITAIADVRSSPRSHALAFNQETLKSSLRQAGIFYVFLGRELGARSPDKNCYVNGKVQYDLLAATDSFQSGLERVERGRYTHQIALMCAEKDPIECHRCILVGRHLSSRGVPVRHIVETGRVEDHDFTMHRLVDVLRLAATCPSEPEQERLVMAYQIQGNRIAYQNGNRPSHQYGLWK